MQIARYQGRLMKLEIAKFGYIASILLFEITLRVAVVEKENFCL